MIALANDGWWPDWSLFGDALATGAWLGLVLPWLGVLLLLRQQVFVVAAIGQAANLGVALALAVAALLGACPLHVVGASSPPWVVAASVLPAVVAAWAALRAGDGTRAAIEARSAVVFLVGSAGAMVALANQPHGAQELQRMFLSSLLSAGPADTALAATAAVVVAGALWLRPRTLLAWAADPRTARAHGVPTRALDLAAAVVVGVVVGQALLATGLLYTFAATTLPVFAARTLAGSLRGVVLLAPAFGLGGQAAAFALAHRFDLPPGQVAVLVYAALAGLAGLRRR